MQLGLGLGFLRPKASQLSTENIYLFGDSIIAQQGTNSAELASVITNITKANPAVVTWTGHVLATGDKVYIWGVHGMTELNENIYTVTKIDANTFNLNVDSTNLGTYVRYGKAFKTEDAGFNKSPIGYITYLQMLSRQRFGYLYKNKRGVISDQSSSLDTRKTIEILPGQGITVVCVLIGTNDITANVSNSALQSNITSIINYIVNTVGAKVILGTVPPRNSDSSTQKDQREAHNIWVRAQSSSNVIVWDFYDDVTDPSTRNWKTGYSTDGVHPVSVGAAIMGKRLHETLLPFYGRGPAYSIKSTNLLTNPTLTGTGGSSPGTVNNGTATGYATTISGNSTSSYRTISKSAQDEQVMEVAFPSGIGNNNGFTIKQDVLAANLVVGQDYIAEGEISFESFSGTGAMTQASLNLGNSTTTLSVDHGPYNGTPTDPLNISELISLSGTQRLQFKTLPVKFLSGYTKLTVTFYMRFNNTSGDTNARVKIHNLQLYPAN